MPISGIHLTLLPRGLTPRPTLSTGARAEGSTVFVDAVLTVPEGGGQAAAAVMLVRGVDSHRLGRIGPSPEAVAREALSVAAVLDAVRQRG